jgi:hypothetical protein
MLGESEKGETQLEREVVGKERESCNRKEGDGMD